MHRIAILCALGTDQARKAIKSLEDELTAQGFDVRFRESHEAEVTDILSVDLLILGSQGGATLHPDFEEIRRALTGMNLAGRLAGLVDFGGGSPAAFRDALKDTDIEIFEEELDLTGDPDVKAVRGWGW